VNLLKTFKALDQSASLSDALTAAVKGAAAEAPRAALFIVNGSRLEEYAGANLPLLAGGAPSFVTEPDLLGDAVRKAEIVRSDGNGSGPKPPAFAKLTAGRRAMAVPLVLEGHPVALLYADDGPEGTVATSWQDSVQALARHASACLAYLTASRTVQAMRLLANQSTASPATDDEDARRYARLLVSEIRLYNEAAVRLGRQNRDLMSRLRPEIDRARRLYEERISSSVHGRDAYFRQELVQTLADGDAALLG
jgi:hypothetical protein